MPPRAKKTTETQPSTMKELKDTLWKAADKLRGSMDASQYKDVILGMVFLKYVSDAYDERRAQVEAGLRADGMDDEQVAMLIDDPEEYHGYQVFVVPPAAQWSYLATHAKGLPASMGEQAKSIGALIDDAMDAVMLANPTLAGTLPRIFNRDNVDQKRLGELIDLFNSRGLNFTRQGEGRARDLLGEVYEYFLEKFARAEGKRGGEFYTPASVVKVLVEVLQPTSGRVYDPCCGSGGMFVQTEKFIRDHDGEPTAVSIFGQENNERTWRMAKMNLAIHGIGNEGLHSRWGDTFVLDYHADKQMHFVMANGSMSTNSGGEGEIRARIVEADLVSCMVALPTQLFRSTGIPVCVWFFAKDKGIGAQGSVDRTGRVLFIDARELGFMVDRAERSLAPEDIARIADTYHSWRGSPSAVGEGKETYADVPGFCASVTLADIKAADYALTPGRYVGAPEAEDDGEPIEQKIERLTKELFAAFDENARLEQIVRTQLARLS